MTGNNGGPWGSGGSNKGGGGDRRPGSGGNGGGDRPSQIPEIDDLMRKGQERLRVLMGGRGDGNRPGGPGGGSGGPNIGRGTIGLGVLAAVALWAFSSFYTVKPEEQSVELFLGSFSSIGQPGLNFAPWPFVTAEVVNVTSERTETLGERQSGGGPQGLMLTTDANIVDINFQVVWNIADPAKLLFNIRDPQLTVSAVSESVMREIISASNLAPILNRDRALIAQTAKERIQETLNAYDSGIRIVRVNLLKADPPAEVIDSFREVQAAEQERDRLQRQADAYANRVMAEARGEAAQIREAAEGYRARVVNVAEGEASRFTSIVEQYATAPEIIRKRMYLETMENVLGKVDKVILDENLSGENGQGGIVPYLPLNELRRSGTTSETAPSSGTTAEGN